MSRPLISENRLIYKKPNKETPCAPDEADRRFHYRLKDPLRRRICRLLILEMRCNASDDIRRGGLRSAFEAIFLFQTQVLIDCRYRPMNGWIRRIDCATRCRARPIPWTKSLPHFWQSIQWGVSICFESRLSLLTYRQQLIRLFPNPEVSHPSSDMKINKIFESIFNSNLRLRIVYSLVVLQ